MATRRIGQILVDLGYLTEDQLWDVLEEQKQSPGEVLGQVAVRLELVTDELVTEALAEQWGMPVVNLRETTIPPKVLELVPQTMAEIYKIVPISLKNDLLTVAMGLAAGFGWGQAGVGIRQAAKSGGKQPASKGEGVRAPMRATPSPRRSAPPACGGPRRPRPRCS